MAKYRVTEQNMLDAYLDYMSWSHETVTTKTYIRDFLVNGVFMFAAEDGRFEDLAIANGFTEYRYGNIRKAVNLIADTLEHYIRIGLLFD